MGKVFVTNRIQMNKRVKRKKKIKKRIESKVKEAYKSNKFLFVIRNDVVELIAHKSIRSKRVNQQVNNLSNKITDQNPDDRPFFLINFVFTDNWNKFLGGSYKGCEVFSYDYPEFELFKWITSFDKRGVNLSKLLEQKSKLKDIIDVDTNNKASHDAKIKGIYYKLLKKLINVYGVVAMSWTKCFWYKPWLKKISKQKGFSYLAGYSKI